MNASLFDEVVLAASDFLARAGAASVLDGAQAGDPNLAVRHAFDVLGACTLEEGGKDWRPVAELLAATPTSPEAYDAALALAAHLVRFNLEMPDDLRDWVWSAMTGKAARPRAKGKAPVARVHRDDLIRDAIHYVVQRYDLHPTRNEAPSENSAAVRKPVSACDAVAAAMVRLRRRPQSYSGIKAIWDERKSTDLRPDWLSVT